MHEFKNNALYYLASIFTLFFSIPGHGAYAEIKFD